MRTVIIVATLALFVLLLPLGAMAAGNNGAVSAEQLLERIQQRFHGSDAATTIHNVQADFYQKAHIASLDRTQTGRGTMSMMFSHNEDNSFTTMFHWSYEVPNQQQVICDGKNLWVYIPDNNQVMLSTVNDKSYYSEDPLLFLRNLGQLTKYFSVAWGESAGDAGDYQLVLTPLESSVYIHRLVLRVPRWLATAPQRQGFPLTSATVIDPGGNRTQLEFRNVRINRKLERSQFTFNVPDGVDIVHPSDLSVDFK